MQRKSFAVDYRQFRLSKLNDESFRHLKLLLFWPIYGFFFYFVEKLYSPVRYYPMHCALDDMIPFCELFLIPYLAWFLCIVGMLLYTMLYDIGAFKRFMYFIILTYSVTIVIYLIFPPASSFVRRLFRATTCSRRWSGIFTPSTPTPMSARPSMCSVRWA